MECVTLDMIMIQSQHTADYVEHRQGVLLAKTFFQLVHFRPQILQDKQMQKQRTGLKPPTLHINNELPILD